MPEVRFSEGIGGGKELVVGAGGRVRVLAGGAIVGSGGGKANAISTRSVTTVTAGAVLASKANPNYSTLASGINSILAVLRTAGLLAT